MRLFIYSFIYFFISFFIRLLIDFVERFLRKCRYFFSQVYCLDFEICPSQDQPIYRNKPNYFRKLNQTDNYVDREILIFRHSL